MRLLWFITGWFALIAGIWQRIDAGEHDAESASLVVSAMVLFVGCGILQSIRDAREK